MKSPVVGTASLDYSLWEDRRCVYLSHPKPPESRIAPIAYVVLN